MTPKSTIIALWTTWLVTWGVAAFWSNRTVKTARTTVSFSSRKLIWVVGVLVLVAFSNRPGGAEVALWNLNATCRWILVTLTGCGFLFVWWSRIHLGRLWSGLVTQKAGHHVVDTGPYRYVRHPIYSGLIFSAFATAIESGTLIALFDAAIFALAFYMKARWEERFLRTELGENAYDTYARKTAMLVPFTERASSYDPPIYSKAASNDQKSNET